MCASKKPPRRTAARSAGQVGRPTTAGRQVDGHRQEREDHRWALVHNYVQVVADLIDQEGEARVVDIARRFGVSHVTALRAIKRLHEEGLAETKPRRAVFLTEDGWDLVERLRRRYDIVVRMLRSLGVSEATAHTDAEGMEHHVSDETLAAFERALSGGGPRLPDSLTAG
jgi:DtxR family manganese transport transcriptional regulator